MSRPGSLLILLPLILAGLSGCFEGSGPDPSPTPTPFVFVDPMTTDANHDHRDPAAHDFRLNVSLVGHNPLVEQEGEAAQSHAIDACGNWVAVGREFPGTEGVDIVDVSDPANPEWVGRFRDPNAVGGDRNVAWSADCRFIFMATEGNRTEQAGVRVIRAEDKTQPRFESYYNVNPSARIDPTRANVGGGVHTIYALQVGGVQYVYALNYGVHILRLEEVAGTARLVLAGRYASNSAQQLAEAAEGGDPTTIRRTIYGHDMTVYEEGGRTILYVAYAYEGLRVVDITNPAAPMELAQWVPPGPGDPHYVHGVKSYTRADGRRITIVEAETFEERNLKLPSPIWILDTTDFRNLRLLSSWTNPGGHGGDRLFYSTHFMALDGDELWMAHYHGGVWVLDLSDPSRPRVAGYYMPSEDTAYLPNPNCCIGWKLSGIPMTFDVVFHRGVAWAADFSTGLYGLRRDAA